MYNALYAHCNTRIILSFLGGLTAVIYTDTLQAFIMIIGASTLSIIGESCFLRECKETWYNYTIQIHATGWSKLKYV